MEKSRIIQLLQYEHECMRRKANNWCDSNCEECDIVQDDKELHEMYDTLITFLTNTSMAEAHLITLEEVVCAPLGSVVWLEVKYEGVTGTGLEPLLVDIDRSQDPVLVNARISYDNICEEQLKEDIIKSMSKNLAGSFRFWNAEPTSKLMKETSWIN